MRGMGGGDKVVVAWEDGGEAVEGLRRILAQKSVMGGWAYIATHIKSPGVIEHTGQMERIQFGPLLASQKEMSMQFLDACRKANIQAEVPADIVKANWEKFVFLVGISSATAVARTTVGVIRSDPDLRWLLEQAMRETWRLARKKGIALADDFVETRMKNVDGLHPDMKASLLHDLEHGGRLEAPWLCGAVARLSAESRLDPPGDRGVVAGAKAFIVG